MHFVHVLKITSYLFMFSCYIMVWHVDSLYKYHTKTFFPSRTDGQVRRERQFISKLKSCFFRFNGKKSMFLEIHFIWLSTPFYTVKLFDSYHGYSINTYTLYYYSTCITSTEFLLLFHNSYYLLCSNDFYYSPCHFKIITPCIPCYRTY